MITYISTYKYKTPSVMVTRHYLCLHYETFSKRNMFTLFSSKWLSHVPYMWHLIKCPFPKYNKLNAITFVLNFLFHPLLPFMLLPIWCYILQNSSECICICYSFIPSLRTWVLGACVALTWCFSKISCVLVRQRNNF